MSRPIAVVFCPGRGSYGRDELGCLARQLRAGPVADALALADAARQADGRPTISELDAADRFKPGSHLEGRNAAELIYFATLAQLEALREQYEIVAVAGNSLGWYTALPAAGCMTPSEGWQLVATMAKLQQLARGAQLLTTVVDSATWKRDPALVSAVDAALADVNALGADHFVARSIRLGGHEVLAGTSQGITRLMEVLPRVQSPEREFPFVLAGHGPFHTALCHDVATAAVEELKRVPIGNPQIHLIDGRGNVHTPWSADPAAILHYTATAQVTTTFDFTAAVRTAMREFQPDVLLCAGPGKSLRAPIGHVVLAERFREIETREQLFASGVVAVS